MTDKNMYEGLEKAALYSNEISDCDPPLPGEKEVSLSIAISLKRIADVLDESLRTGHCDGRTFHDLLADIARK